MLASQKVAAPGAPADVSGIQENEVGPPACNSPRPARRTRRMAAGAAATKATPRIGPGSATGRGRDVALARFRENRAAELQSQHQNGRTDCTTQRGLCGGRADTP